MSDGPRPKLKKTTAPAWGGSRDLLPIGARVILLGVYPGKVHAHRPPGLMVELDRPIHHQRIVMANPWDVKLEKA